MNRRESEEFIIGQVFLMSNKLNQIGDSLTPEITFKQWLLLMVISKMETDEKNINHITEAFGTTRQNVKKMLIPLESKGYIVVSKSIQDARALMVELTPKTYQHFLDNEKAMAKETNRLFSSFSYEEIIEIVNSFGKLMQSIEIYTKGDKYT